MLDLSANRALERLDLHDASHPAVPHLLYQCTSAHVRRLRFTISKLRAVRHAEYEAIESLISSDAFGDLEDVCFIYSGPLNLSNAATAIHQVFSTSHGRRILRVIRASPMVRRPVC